MRVHVTGGSGFLGSRVVPLLVDARHEVMALARSADAAEVVARLGATPVLGDLDDAASLDAAFAAGEPEALVNLASLGFGHAPAIVAAAEEAGLERAVFVSTTSLFTRLGTGSKHVRSTAEDTIRASTLQWTIIRPTMIYGDPGDRNMARLLRLVRRSPAVPLPGGGRGLQQPVHVEDLARAVVASLTSSSAVGRSYNVAGPEALTLRQVVEQAGAAVGRRPICPPVPLGAVVALARVYEVTSRRPRLKAEQVERLAEDKAFDISPARLDLQFDPRPFAEGIRQQAEAR